MYKWPKEFPPSELRGLTVEMVSFTLNSISIAFGDECLITVTSSLHLQTEGREEDIPIPPRRTGLISLVGKSVQSSELEADEASLLIEFDEGSRLRLEGGDTHYECFDIQVKGEVFYV